MRRKARIDPAEFIPTMSTRSVSLEKRLCPVCPESSRINLIPSSTAHLMKDIMVGVG